MKKIVFILFVGLVGIFQACKKETTQLPPREVSPEVAEIAENYTDILVASQEGWILAYKPDQYEETLYFHLVFKNEEKVDVTAGYKGYHTLQSDVTYHFEGNYIPVIVFSGENVFSELADSYNGTSKFKIYYNEAQGIFEVVRSDGFDDKRFELMPANENNLALLNAQIDAVLAQIEYEEELAEQERLVAEIRAKVKAFVEIESDFYFYNFTVDDFSAAINSFDTTAREISLTYKESSTSAPVTATVGYTLTPEGIALNPVIAYGSVSIDLIELGDLKYEDTDDPAKPTAIEIVGAGNAGTGVMGYAHVAPYPFTREENRNQTLAEFFMNEYTSSVESRAVFGPKVPPLRNDFMTYIRNLDNFNPSGRHVYIIYSPNMSGNTSLRNIFWIGSSRRINESSAYANMGFNLRVNMQNLGANVVSVNNITEQTNVNISNNVPDISVRTQEYLDEVMPSQGMTMVPVFYENNSDGDPLFRLRLVSTVDSRIWFEYFWPVAHRIRVFN